MFSCASVFGAEIPKIKNAGFAPSVIWYSKVLFFAGDKIKIYTIVFNGSEYTVSGEVEFLDNGSVVGLADFHIAGDGNTRVVSADWVPGEGNHRISARIVNTKFTDADGIKQSFVSELQEFSDKERTVERNPVSLDAEKANRFIEVSSHASKTAEQAVAAAGDIVPLSVQYGIAESIQTAENFRTKTAAYFAKKHKQTINEYPSAAVLPKKENKNETAEIPNFVKDEYAKTEMLQKRENGTPETFLIFLYAGLLYFFQSKFFFYGFLVFAVYAIIMFFARKTKRK